MPIKNDNFASEMNQYPVLVHFRGIKVDEKGVKVLMEMVQPSEKVVWVLLRPLKGDFGVKRKTD